MSNLGGSNKLLTVTEVSQLLNVPRATVYDCWRSWGLEAYRIGKHLRFRERHVEAMLNRCKVN